MWSLSCGTNWLFSPVFAEARVSEKKKKKTRRTLITSSHTGRCRNGSSRRWRRAHDPRQEDLNWAGWMSGLIRALSGISLNPLPWLIARTHKRTQTAKPPWMQTSLSRSLPQSLSLSRRLICIYVNTLIATH